MNNNNIFTRLILAASPCIEFAKTQLSLKEKQFETLEFTQRRNYKGANISLCTVLHVKHFIALADFH